MHCFTDSQNRTWTITINVAAIKRVRALLRADLYKAADDGFKALASIVSDPVQLVDVLYVLCRDEAQARGVSDEQFGSAMAGDVLLHAADAFVEELIDFFPDARARSTLRSVIHKGKQLRDLVIEQVQQQIDVIDPRKEVLALLAVDAPDITSKSSSSSTSLPALSE